MTKCGKYLLLLTGFILVMIPLQSQNTREAWPGERILLFTDRELYVVGEELLFKVHTLDASSARPVHYSDVLYMEVLDRQQSPLVREKFAIHRGEADGKLILPVELGSDHYLLRAYTGWMKNEGPQYFAYQLITVINPYEKIRSDMIIPDTCTEQHPGSRNEPVVDPSRESGLIIKAVVDRDTFGTREKVVLDIVTSNRYGTPVEAILALSLAREGLMETGEMIIPADPGPSNRLANVRYPPELGGHIISGYITERSTGQRMSGDTLLLSLVGRTARFDYAVSDSNGHFWFLVKGVGGPREVVIQHINPRRAGYQIRLDDPFLDDFQEAHIPDFIIDTNQLTAINRAVVNAQIHAVYAIDTIPDRRGPGQTSFYGNPEYRVMLDDYLRLPEMREVFFELVPSAQMRGRAEQTTIRIRDKRSQLFFPSPPLMLVDGVVTREPQDISGLDAREVERIELVNCDYFYGMLHFPGILSIVTAAGNCPIDLPPQVFRQSYDFFSGEKQAPFPEYPDDARRQSPLPDFRNTLYWDPHLRTGKNGRARIEFYTADDRADYSLLIRGITMEGWQGTLAGSFSVR
jgi:hypothetical protein